MVPKTRLGKLLCIIYMLFCTLLIAALTSVYTERMTNTDVDFKGKSVSEIYTCAVYFEQAGTRYAYTDAKLAA